MLIFMNIDEVSNLKIDDISEAFINLCKGSKNSQKMALNRQKITQIFINIPKVSKVNRI